MLSSGLERRQLRVDGVPIAVRTAGQGAPLLLLHGHPQTHAMWHAVAPALAQRFRVVLMDLRGYGDSGRPPGGPAHAAYARRTMARDAVQVMAQLGHARFGVCGHDRGARVAHRLALDHPGCVQRLMLLDIAPTLDMYRLTDEAFARAYWHWFFLIQPAPLPERLIEADPARYVRDLLGRGSAGLAPFAPAALAEYERCAALPGSAHAMCEDYRAAAGIDLQHDKADVQAGHRVQAPLRVLWGGQGVVGRCFDVLALWQARAAQACGRALPCGHYLAEERPDLVLDEALQFFAPLTTGGQT